MKRVFALTICLLLVMAAPALAQNSIAVVNAPSGKLHLRAAASSSAASLGLYFTGTKVMITGEAQGDFIPVRVGAETGYMHADYLALDDAADSVASVQTVGVATPKVGARLRSGPSAGYESLLVMDQGEAFTVLGETKDHWYYVGYAGQTGYVSAEVANIVGETGMTPDVFYAVLAGKEPFERRGGRATMAELNACFGVEADLAPKGFVLLNLDDDMLMEAVVRVGIGEEDFGFLVLDLQTELVYGYTFNLRSMLDLKQDGTFSFSSGAMDNGVGRLSFRGPVADVIQLARCRDGANGEIVYLLGGEVSTQAEYEGFLSAQERKPGVSWIAFTDEEIGAL